MMKSTGGARVPLWIFLEYAFLHWVCFRGPVIALMELGVYFAGLNFHVWCLGLSLSRLMYNFTWHYVYICNNLAITYKIAIILLYYITKGYFHVFIPEKHLFTILLLLLLFLYCLHFKEPISTFLLFPHAPNLMVFCSATGEIDILWDVN